MIPEEGDQASTAAMTALMSSDKRKLTLANVDQNRASARLPSGSTKRYSEPIVGGAAGHQNPWDDNKRLSVAERKKSTLPGGLKELGRGLNCEDNLCTERALLQ